MEASAPPLKFSDAILAGCKIAPRKCKAQYWDGTGAACILGSAALGSGVDPRSSSSGVVNHLLQYFPQAFQDVKICVFTPTVKVAMGKNDFTDESRESIAQWLAEQGL